jgi:type I restriction enzyme R subunit
MSTHTYTESQLVEQPAIGLFAALGWQTVPARGEILGSDGTLGRATKGEVVLADWPWVVAWAAGAAVRRL